MSHSSTANPDPHDLVISRLVRAPRATLWRAWTEPQLLKSRWPMKAKVHATSPT